MFARKTPIGLHNLFRYLMGRFLTGRDVAVTEVQWWAGQYGLELVALEPCRIPSANVLRQFPFRAHERAEHRYFEISAIDLDHVRHSGVARVYREMEIAAGLSQTVQVVWLASEQLNWRARPPRRTAGLPHDHAQGWYIDPARAHELRWYSSGRPTDLVKDGATESRDPPVSPPAP